MTTPLVTQGNLGAWLLRCNPDVWDLRGFIEDGGTNITEWDVARNYRSAMMAEGQRVVLWVTGNKQGLGRGIWGMGHVTNAAHDPIPAGLAEEEAGYWLEGEASGIDHDSVATDIPLLSEPLLETDLRAAGITDLEVQRQPQGQNPSWVSKSQLASLEALLPPWPVAADDRRQMTVSSREAGFGDAAQNKIVEMAAMQAVSAMYKQDGWRVEDVSDRNYGWDLACSRGTESYKLEVKGVSGDRPSVLLTANELRAAREESDWWLAVVTRAVSSPSVIEYSADEAIALAQPYVFRLELPLNASTSRG